MSYFKCSIHIHCYAQTHTAWVLTSRKGELNLLIDDLQSDEVMLLVEPAIVEKQGVPFSGSKPKEKDRLFKVY